MSRGKKSIYLIFHVYGYRYADKSFGNNRRYLKITYYQWLSRLYFNGNETNLLTCLLVYILLQNLPSACLDLKPDYDIRRPYFDRIKKHFLQILIIIMRFSTQIEFVYSFKIQCACLLSDMILHFEFPVSKHVS